MSLILQEFDDLPAGTELTGVWSAPAGLAPSDSGVAVGFLIRLPGNQDPEAEANMLWPHLSGNLGGLTGRRPDGESWMLLVNSPSMRATRAPAPWSTMPIEPGSGPPDRTRAMDLVARAEAELARVQFGVALDLNPFLVTQQTFTLTRPDIHDHLGRAYRHRADLEVFDLRYLIHSLLAEACGYPLPDALLLRDRGCAFPSRGHLCQGDVITDVYAAWTRMEIRPGDQLRDA